MPDVKNIFKQIGDSLKGKTRSTGAAPAKTPAPAGGAGPHGAQTAKLCGAGKPVEFQLYMVAVQNASKEFFQKKLPWFFKNMGPAFKNFQPWWKKQKQDEQIAIVGWITGHLLMLIGIILLIVM